MFARFAIATGCEKEISRTQWDILHQPCFSLTLLTTHCTQFFAFRLGSSFPPSMSTRPLPSVVHCQCHSCELKWTYGYYKAQPPCRRLLQVGLVARA